MAGGTEEIPFGDLRRAYYRDRGAIDAAIARVLESGWFVLGSEVATFEGLLAATCGVDHAVGVGNGTDAIALALRAVGVAPGDEVVTTPLTAAFTALAIAQIGAVPIFADIDPSTWNLSPDGAEAAVTARTKAILPVHLYGRPADMAALRQIADSAGLALIEDAAQAIGAHIGGAPAGSLGDAAAFSFYPSKNLGAFGDGGAVTTTSAAVAERVRVLRDGGQAARYRHEVAGVNSRLDELQAAILVVRLARLAADNDRRHAIAGRYRSALAGRDDVVLPDDRPGTRCAYHLFVMRVADRDGWQHALARAGVATAVHYPIPVHRQPAFADRAVVGEFPEAEAAAREVLSVPLYPELTDGEVDRIAEALQSGPEGGRRP